MSDHPFVPLSTERDSGWRQRWRENQGNFLLGFTALVAIGGVATMYFGERSGAAVPELDQRLSVTDNFEVLEQLPKLPTNLNRPSSRSADRNTLRVTPRPPQGTPVQNFRGINQTRESDQPSGGVDRTTPAANGAGLMVESDAVAGDDADWPAGQRPAEVLPPGMIRCAIFGAANDEGTVRMAIYGDAATFNIVERAVLRRSLRIERGAAFCDVPVNQLPGQFAVAAYHDQNDNGELDRNYLQIPTERYGYTNRARGILGPPPFESAVIDAPPAGLELRVLMR